MTCLGSDTSRISCPMAVALNCSIQRITALACEVRVYQARLRCTTSRKVSD